MTLHASAFDPTQRRGWSVVVTGRVHGTPDLGVTADSPTALWIPCGGGDVIELAIEVVEGERLGPRDELDVKEAAP